jgi:hypothetical protein
MKAKTLKKPHRHTYETLVLLSMLYTLRKEWRKIVRDDGYHPEYRQGYYGCFLGLQKAMKIFRSEMQK